MVVETVEQSGDVGTQARPGVNADLDTPRLEYSSSSLGHCFVGIPTFWNGCSQKVIRTLMGAMIKDTIDLKRRARKCTPSSAQSYKVCQGFWPRLRPRPEEARGRITVDITINQWDAVKHYHLAQKTAADTSSL